MKKDIDTGFRKTIRFRKEIFVSKYQTFLPSKEELKAVLNETMEGDENIRGGEA